jgi:hypothetical protein
VLISISKETKHARLDLLISAAAVDMEATQQGKAPRSTDKRPWNHQSEERTFNLHSRTSASCRAAERTQRIQLWTRVDLLSGAMQPQRPFSLLCAILVAGIRKSSLFHSNPCKQLRSPWGHDVNACFWNPNLTVPVAMCQCFLDQILIAVGETTTRTQLHRLLLARVRFCKPLAGGGRSTQTQPCCGNKSPSAVGLVCRSQPLGNAGHANPGFST